MKNRFLKHVLILLPVAVVLSAFAGILHAMTDHKEIYPVTRVSVILPHKDDGYWDLIMEGIEEAGCESGSKFNIDINTLIPQLNYNISQITDLVKQQIAAKVDYIVVQGNEDEEFLSVLRDACEQGIHVVCVDTDIRDFPEHLYVGSDNYQGGKMLGEHLLELTGGTAKVAVLSGSEEYSNLQQRLEGFRDATEEHPEIEITEIAYDNYDGLTAMRLYQEMSDQADALVCLEGTCGMTLEALYDEHRDEYKYVIGFDAHDGAKKGVLDGIVKQDTNRMGHQVVEEIRRHIETGSYSSNCIYTDIFWVTAENYDEVMG